MAKRHNVQAAAFGLGLFFTLLANSGLQAQSAWEQKKDQNGVRVYVREVEGQSFKESKATIRFKASVQDVVNVLLDYPGYSQWAPRVVQARLVEKASDQVYYSYSINDAPWPVTDRDIVLKNALSYAANGAATIRMSAVKGKVPESKDAVRMTYFEGHYAIVPTGSGMVEVTYQAIMDPAGSVPAWMANMAVVDTPYDLLLSLRKRVTGA